MLFPSTFNSSIFVQFAKLAGTQVNLLYLKLKRNYFILSSEINEYQKQILEDLKVLRRSPDLLNNVKIGQGQLQLIMEQILFLTYTFWSSDLNNLMNNPSNSTVISEKKMFR